MRILLLSAYHAASHRYWCEGLMAAFPEHQWQLLTLPPRFFRWRIRGNPLSWIQAHEEVLRRPHDLLIVTSMVDLATLKGLVPQLARTPSLCYFHENQLAYPLSNGARPGGESAMVNIYSALAADTLVFNTAYNRDSFLDGCRTFLRRMPDCRPGDLEPLLRERIQVLPVPLQDDELAPIERPRSTAFKLCWNHRWEYDKGPDRLLLTLRELRRRRLPLRLNLLGESFRQVPESLQTLVREFEDCLDEAGFVRSRRRYLEALAESTLVLSTSLHEFQGLAVMEAAALGALPRVPDRLSYRELFPPGCRYPARAEAAEEARGLADSLEADWQAHRDGCLEQPPSMAGYFWSSLKPAYAAVLEDCARSR